MWFVVAVIVGTVFGATSVLLRSYGQNVPDIYVDNETIDLGIINGLNRDPNIPRRISFKIHNRGTGVLRLIRMKADCACIRPLLKRSALLPGETTTLSMGVVIPNRIGKFHEKVLLHTNDAKQPVKTFIVKGLVHRPCYVLPESVVVNNLREGEQRWIELEVYGPEGDNTFIIKNVSTITNIFELSGLENAGILTKSNRLMWRVEMTIHGRSRGSWEDTILISTSNKESPLLKVPVKVRELSPIRVEPPLVILRRNADNETPTAQVEITVNTLKPVTIINVEKPDWIDLCFESDVRSLPARLHLTVRKVPDKINVSIQNAIVLELREQSGKVRIPVLLIHSKPTATGSKGGEAAIER